MKKIFKYFLAGLSVIHPALIYSQTTGVTNPQMNTVTIQTPNAASIGRFGDFPVSYYNGLVDISIPIYEIKTPSLTVPISIRYHPSGIRVTDIASRVGLGWALDAGGSVSRKVMGNIDEDVSKGYLSGSNNIRNNSLQNWYTSQTDINYLNNMHKGLSDGEPDVFSYSAPGKSGRFLFNRDKVSLIKIPMDKTKITTDIQNNLITVIDENGITYRFGKGLDGSTCIETTKSYNPSNGTLVQTTSAWFLSTIISADKTDTIFFKYFSRPVFPSPDQMDYVVIKDQHISGGTSPQIFGSDFGQSFNTQVQPTQVQLELKEIDFRNGMITFDSSVTARLDLTGDKKLDKITVSKFDFVNATFQPVKSVQFYTSYYNSNDRLRLDSVRILDKQGLLPQTYKFTYNATLLPAFQSRQRDWWGYYNSNPGSTLVPLTSINYINDGGTGSNVNIGNANRDPDTTRVKACVLEKIFFPTGGRTEFDYETNKYTLNSVNYNGGGLRIRRVITYESATATPVVTTYKYGSAESGYGIFNVPVNFTGINNNFFSSSIVSVNWGVSHNASNPETIRSRTFTTNLNFDLVAYDGSPVYYDYVTEYKVDPLTGINLGKTVYNYSFFGDINNSYVLNSVAKLYTQTNYWRRGYLASRTMYNAAGSLVYQLSNNYGPLQTTLYDSVGLLVNRNYDYVNAPLSPETPQDPYIGGPNFPKLFDYASYSVQTGNVVLFNSTETTYDQLTPANSQVKTTTYVYNSNNYQPSQVTTNLSTTEKEVINIKYPVDYIVSASPDAKSLAIKNLQDNNIITATIEKYKQKMNNDGSNPRTTAAVLNSYKTTTPWLDTLYQVETTSGLTNFSASVVTGNNFIKDSRYTPRIAIDNYDARGNTSQQSKINDARTSYIWDYNKTYPTAVVTNASITEIAYTGFEGDANGNWTILDNSRSTEFITGDRSFILNPINNIQFYFATGTGSYLLSYWSRDGQVSIGGVTVNSTRTGLTKNGWTYYEYSITAPLASTITLTSASPKTIDELRLFPVASKMTTYAYTPLIGITSQCSPNNMITYYNYDSYGRLQFIRDLDGNIIKSFEYNIKQ